LETSQNFDSIEEVFSKFKESIEKEKYRAAIVLVLFTAEWCPPCRRLKNILFNEGLWKDLCKSFKEIFKKMIHENLENVLKDKLDFPSIKKFLLSKYTSPEKCVNFLTEMMNSNIVLITCVANVGGEANNAEKKLATTLGVRSLPSLGCFLLTKKTTMKNVFFENGFKGVNNAKEELGTILNEVYKKCANCCTEEILEEYAKENL